VSTHITDLPTLLRGYLSGHFPLYDPRLGTRLGWGRTQPNAKPILTVAGDPVPSAGGQVKAQAGAGRSG
jgi:hypothetical protein